MYIYIDIDIDIDIYLSIVLSLLNRWHLFEFYYNNYLDKSKIHLLQRAYVLDNRTRWFILRPK